MSKISVTTIAGLTSGGDANTVKIEAGDDFTVDTSVLKVDASADKVGINNVSPSQLLSVGQTAQAGTTTPASITLGGQYNSGTGSEKDRLKLRLWEADTSATESMGLGISTNSIDYLVSHAAYQHQFFVGGSKIVKVNTHGLLFGTDTAAANALDDYEEGNFTPSFSNGISSATYSSQIGRYTKIGNMVFFSIHLRANGGTANSGHVTITGLPFTANSSLNQEAGWFSYNGGFYNTSGLTPSGANGAWLVLGGSTSMAFYRDSDGAALAGTSSGIATNLNADCRVAGFYRT